MAVIDKRTVTENQASYYVLDDLRYQQNTSRAGRHCFDIFRYDTLNEAINKFREIPEDMTPALGMHLSARSELDLIHRRQGEAVLVTDYQNFPDWRNNQIVQSAVEKTCEELNVQWQMNSKLITRGTVLIPLQSSERVPDKVFDNKNLAPKPPRIYSDCPNPMTAITEAYVEGQGWTSFDEVFKAAERFGFRNPDLPKITQFNINYIDNNGRSGQADISPLDLHILEERYTILHGNKFESPFALQKLAVELDEFAEEFDFYDYKDQVDDKESHIEQLKSDLSEGKVNEIVSFLREIGEDNGPESAKALRLASRIQGLDALERKPTLDSQIQSADTKKAATGRNEQTRTAPENER